MYDYGLYHNYFNWRSAFIWLIITFKVEGLVIFRDGPHQIADSNKNIALSSMAYTSWTSSGQPPIVGLSGPITSAWVMSLLYVAVLQDIPSSWTCTSMTESVPVWLNLYQYGRICTSMQGMCVTATQEYNLHVNLVAAITLY